LLERVTRTLRHEIGDLLQSVYSTVAILQERLDPNAALERRFLGDLRTRAETCKYELDAVQDLVVPWQLDESVFDLARLSANLVDEFAARDHRIQIIAESDGCGEIWADARRLEHVGRLILAGACHTARNVILVRVGPAANGDDVEWTFSDDGEGATPEQLQWLEKAFATTQQALLGLGLALARLVAERHGGSISAANLPDGGFRIVLVLPKGRPND
jgi:signal transduction histidine kinase